MDVEARFLAAAADRARVLDHKGNRGTDAEHAVVRWLRDRIEPEYTVSSGEVVDSFQTNIDRDSRQHDAIVHENSRFARRFSLQSGLRLVPIETVALIVEIKLDLDATKFKDADDAAAETAKLRLAVDRFERVAGAGGPVSERMKPGPEGGMACNDRELRGRVRFAVFAFNGPKRRETIAEWLRAARAIELVCCLDSGCAYRPPHAKASDFGGWTSVSSPERSLTYFGQLVGGTINQFEASAQSWRARKDAYSDYRPLTFWDATGFVPPPGYQPTDEEVAELSEEGLLPPGWKPTPRT